MNSNSYFDHEKLTEALLRLWYNSFHCTKAADSYQIVVRMGAVRLCNRHLIYHFITFSFDFPLPSWTIYILISKASPFFPSTVNLSSSSLWQDRVKNQTGTFSQALVGCRLFSCYWSDAVDATLSTVAENSVERAVDLWITPN